LKELKLVDELKKRRGQGEENLIIKNGSIVKRQSKRHPLIAPSVVAPLSVVHPTTLPPTDSTNQDT